jgi:hypothetical protein
VDTALPPTLLSPIISLFGGGGGGHIRLQLDGFSSDAKRLELELQGNFQLATGYLFIVFTVG